MEGVNKKLLWATIVLAALLIAILSFLAGSYFGQKNNAVPANTGTNNAPTPSGNTSGTTQAQGRTPKEILFGQMFWVEPDGNVGLAVNSETDIRLLMIFGIIQYGQGAVDLFSRHYTRKPVRECHIRHGQFQVCRVLHTVRKSEG